MLKIKFLGAAGTVTGSKYLLTTHNKNFLVDCGIFQGPKRLRERNWRDFDIAPSSISAIILTHAHIDHTGYVPRLVRLGYQGPIYCSTGTYELCKILLPDSGHLQEEEAFYVNKKGSSKHSPALPLYTREDAEYSLQFFRPIDFHKSVAIDHNVEITLSRAGHILGASCIRFSAEQRSIAFSGDVGRFTDLIMKGPEPLFDADYLVIESTYGDRDHSHEDVSDRMSEVINAVIKRNGVVVVPAFAVGRAQRIMYLVNKLKKAGRIPNLPTYLDSPMAINATDLYCQYASEHRLSASECKEIFSPVILTRTPEESRAINEKEGPKIIISASGMATGGRVLHHLSHYITDEKNAIIMVGYQSEGTRGRALVDGATQLKIFGEEYQVRAHIENVSGLSAHADRQELIQWLKNSPIKHPKTFITHGEPSAAKALAELLKNNFNWDVVIPNDLEEYKL